MAPIKNHTDACVKPSEERGTNPTVLGNQQLGESRTLAEALAFPERDNWKTAMDEEYAQDIVKLPKNRKPAGSRWIFKKKLNEHGNPTRYKLRLDAGGFSQKFSIDYDKDASGIIAGSSTSEGEISVTIYMGQPPGFGIGDPEDVCQLRSLYSLKQAGRVWKRTITDVPK